MSRPLKITCKVFVFLLILVYQNASAQMKVDESNVINRLFSLYKYSALEIHNYYESQGYKQFDAKKMSYAKFAITVRRYQKKNSTDNYVLNDVDGQVFAVGYTTTSEQNYKQELKIITDMGFRTKDSKTAMPGQTVYNKADSYDSIIISIKSDQAHTYYNVQVNNLYQSAQLLKQ